MMAIEEVITPLFFDPFQPQALRRFLLFLALELLVLARLPERNVRAAAELYGFSVPFFGNQDCNGGGVAYA